MRKKTISIKTPRWAEPLLGRSRYKGVHGGRGGGKSHFFAELMIESHILDKDRRSICIREIQRSLAQSVKRLLEVKIEEMGVGHFFEVQQSQIKTAGGDGLIIFQGMQNHTAETIKSLEGYDIAWVEEAQTLSQRSLDLLRPTIRKKDSELWFSWNPRHSTDPVDVLLRRNPPPDAVTITALYGDNPWFPEALRREMEYDKSRDIGKWQHVWEGGYITSSEAAVFRHWRVDVISADVLGDAIPLLGADWGFSVDPTALVRCFIVGNLLYIDREAYQVGCEVVNIPVLFDTVPSSRSWPMRADSARPETISHVRRHGFPKIMAATKGPNSVIEGITLLQGFDIVVHPRCANMIYELSMYAYKTDALTDKILPVLNDKDNHLIDALRYAVEPITMASRHGGYAAAMQRVDYG